MAKVLKALCSWVDYDWDNNTRTPCRKLVDLTWIQSTLGVYDPEDSGELYDFLQDAAPGDCLDLGNSPSSYMEDRMVQIVRSPE